MFNDAESNDPDPTDIDLNGAHANEATIGALIKRHRRVAGLTQAELAERARLSLHAVSNLERGAARMPHKTTVDLLASALSLTPDAHDTLLDVLRASRGAEFPNDPFPEPTRANDARSALWTLPR